MKNFYKILILALILISTNKLLAQLFTEQTTISLEGSIYSEWGDYDNDGDLDILICSNKSDLGGVGSVSIYKRNSDNTYSWFEIFHLEDQFPDNKTVNIKATWEDFNKDGQLDVIIGYGHGWYYANGNLFEADSTSILIYINVGNDLFTKQYTFNFLQLFFTDFAWADFDNDTDLDFILSTACQGILPKTTLYWNNNNEFNASNINFREGQKISVTDYNKDNYSDITVMGLDENGISHISLYKNNGNKDFIRQTNLPFMGISDGTIDWGDYDNDGDLDLLTAGTIGSYPNIDTLTNVYRNNGDNSFTYPGSLISTKAISAVWMDYDNNGMLDLFAGSKLYRNEGNNLFTEQFTIAYNGSFAIGDYDNDRDMDFLLSGTNSSYPNLPFSRLFRNNSAISNSAPSVPSNLIHQRTGNQVQFSWSPSNDSQTPTQSLSYNIRIGTSSTGFNIVAPSSNITNGYSRIPKLGNTFLNNEFKINNLAPGNYYWSVQSKDNAYLCSAFSSTSSFTVSPTFTREFSFGGVQYSNAIWANFDNDLDMDFFIEGECYAQYCTAFDIYINNGSNSFLRQAVSTTPYYPQKENSTTAVGDMNNDGLVDILQTRVDFPDRRTALFINNGNNSFTSDFNISSTNDNIIACADFDNDGDLDILVAGDNNTKIYRNNGHGNFTEQLILFTDKLVFGAFACVDYDNDGDIDILITGMAGTINETPITKLYKNDGDNTFSEPLLNVFENVYHSSVDWADYDNDGDLDLALSGNNNQDEPVLNIYRNDGNDQFSNLDIDLRKGTESSIAWGDYNNDGYPDLLVSGLSGENRITKVYKNGKNATFIDIEAPITAVNNGSLAWGDYNNDGNLDILLTGRFVDYSNEGTYEISQLYKNNNNFPNNAPSTPTNPLSELINFNIKLSWDNAVDPDCLDGNLYYNIRVGTTPGNIDIISPHSNPATGYRHLQGMGNVYCNTFWFLKNLVPGIYYWSVQAIDQSFQGGTWATEQSFTVPNIVAKFNADTVCMGATTIFTNTSLAPDPEEPITSWEWTFGDGGGTSTEQNPQYTYGSYGEFEVTLTVRSASYEHTTTQTVVVKPAPVANFDAPAVCQGTLTAITNMSQIAGVTVSSWNWDFDDGTADFTGENPSPHPYTEGSYFMELIIVADNGCTDTLEQEVLVGRIPSNVLSTNGETEFCTGNTFTLTAEDYLNFEYEWRKDDVPILAETSNVFEVTESGTYKVNIINLLGNCTVTSAEYEVIANSVPDSPTINNSASYSICEGESVELSVDEVSNHSYQWYLNGGALSSANTTAINANQEGTYTVAAINSYNCSTFSTDTVHLSVIELPTNTNIQLSGLPAICPGQPIDLSVEENVEFNYQWKKDGENIEGAANAVYTANSEGTYTVEITNNICNVTSPQQSITEKDGPPIPEMYLRGDVVWYIGCSITKGVNYKWYRDAVEIPKSNKQILVPEKPADGIYYVELSDGKECPSRSVNVVIPDDFGTGKFKSLEEFFGEEDTEKEMEVFPNPNSGRFTLLFKNDFTGKIYIRIKDIEGKTIQQYYSDKNQNVFSEDMDMKNQGTGIYFIEVEYDGRKEVKKVVVE